MGCVILVCGLNGVGKSTMAKALAERLNLRFVDIEDIYFSRQDNPDYPYEKSRPYEEVISMLTNLVTDEKDFVLSNLGYCGFLTRRNTQLGFRPVRNAE